jgi:hypothetical protein
MPTANTSGSAFAHSELELTILGTTRGVAQIVTHSGIVIVREFDLSVPAAAPPDQDSITRCSGRGTKIW